MVAAIAPWFCLRLLSCGLGSNPKQTIYGFFNLYCWNWNCYCSCCCIDENNDGNKRKRGPLKSLTWAKRWPEPRWWCWRWRWEVTCGRSTSCPREAWEQCHKTFQAVTNVSVTGFDKISQLWQIFKSLAIYLRVYSVFGKILNPLCKKLLLGKFSLLSMVKFWRNYLTNVILIWSQILMCDTF